MRRRLLQLITSSWDPCGQEEAHVVLPMCAVKSGESLMTFSHVVEWTGSVDSTIRRFVAGLPSVGIAEAAVEVRSRASDPEASCSRIDAHS